MNIVQSTIETTGNGESLNESIKVQQLNPSYLKPPQRLPRSQNSGAVSFRKLVSEVILVAGGVTCQNQLSFTSSDERLMKRVNQLQGENF